MNKILLLSILIVSIFSISITCAVTPTPFITSRQSIMNQATNAAGNVVNDVGQGIGGVINGAGNAINSIGDATKNIGRDLGNGAKNLGNDNTNMTRSTENASNDGNSRERINDGTTTGVTYNGAADGMNMGMGYDASRTAYDTASTTWTWIAVAIAVIAIVALIWYYNSENNREARSRKDRY